MLGLMTLSFPENVRYFIGWLNAARGRTIEPQPAIAGESAHYYGLARFGFDPSSGQGPVSGEFLPPRVTAWGTSGRGLDEKEPWVEDLAVFLDSW